MIDATNNAENQSNHCWELNYLDNTTSARVGSGTFCDDPSDSSVTGIRVGLRSDMVRDFIGTRKKVRDVVRVAVGLAYTRLRRPRLAISNGLRPID